VGYDNITFGSISPTSNTPEPATIGLFGAGLLSLACEFRRRRKM
jgi:hypothetical protein